MCWVLILDRINTTGMENNIEEQKRFTSRYSLLTRALSFWFLELKYSSWPRLTLILGISEHENICLRSTFPSHNSMNLMLKMPQSSLQKQKKIERIWLHKCTNIKELYITIELVGEKITHFPVWAEEGKRLKNLIDQGSLRHAGTMQFWSFLSA